MNIKSTQEESKTSLKIIGAGLSRTSTLSLRAALEQLGFAPCYHVRTHVIPDGAIQGRKWARIGRERNKEKRQALLREMHHGAVAALDAPTCIFIDDYLEMYPDAKYILTVRDSPEAWHASFSKTVGRIFGKPLIYWICFFVPNFTGLFHMNDGWAWICHERYGVDAHSLEVYNAHNGWVKEIVPQEKLLVFNAKQGWEPLCDFLGVEVPQIEYPRVNELGEQERRLRGFLREGITRWLMVLGTVAVLGTGLWKQESIFQLMKR